MSNKLMFTNLKFNLINAYRFNFRLNKVIWWRNLYYENKKIINVFIIKIIMFLVTKITCETLKREL